MKTLFTQAPSRDVSVARPSSSHLVTAVACALWCLASVGHAQIAYRSSSTAEIENNNSGITVNKPSGVVEGDVMLAVVTKNSGSTDLNISAPAGWTQIDQKLINNATNKITGAVFYKAATGSEVSSYRFTFPGLGTASPNYGAVAAIVAFSGVDSSNPIDANGNIKVNAKGSAVSADAITTNTANTAVVMLGMVGGGLLHME